MQSNLTVSSEREAAINIFIKLAKFRSPLPSLRLTLDIEVLNYRRRRVTILMHYSYALGAG